MKDLIDNHFQEGFKYKEIIALLKNCHGIKVSLCALHRFLRQVTFYRKEKQSLWLDIVTSIQHEWQGSGSCTGYRAMHQRCIRNGLMVSRVIVPQIMKHLDPIVNTRRRRTLRRRLFHSPGPSWVWYLDGYDKLKPYDFEIHGCMDGYSRHVLWFSVLRSNKDPNGVCNLYFNYLFIVKSFPRKIVAGRGTENVNIAGSQRFSMWNHSDDSSGYRSFQFGKSTTNQRIESFWSQLCRSCIDWWIRFFKGIVHEGIYDNTDYLQIECFKFCFFALIHKELDDIKD